MTLPEMPAAWAETTKKEAPPAKPTPPRASVGLTDEQLAMRRTGIGGSEIGALLGESRFSTPFDVWLAKTQGWVEPVNEDMKRGSFLEDGIARWYADRFGITAPMHEPGTIRHLKRKVALCTPDRTAGKIGTRTGRLLSIKAPRRSGDLWGEPGTDSVPPEYMLQLQWEWAICESIAPGVLSEEMHLAALLDGDLAVFGVKADAELQEWMLDYAEQWWARHVVRGEQPSMDGSEKAFAWLRSKFPKNTEPARPATRGEIRLCLELQMAEQESKRWASEAETIKSELKQSIGNASGIEAPCGFISWKADKNGVRSFKPKWTKEKQ